MYFVHSNEFYNMSIGVFQDYDYESYHVIRIMRSKYPSLC